MEKYNYHTDMGKPVKKTNPPPPKKPYNLPQTPFPLPIITIKVLVAILKQVSRCLNGIPHTLIYTNPGATISSAVSFHAD